jgi:SPP1 family predicted phage head-tail adaptor
MSGGPAAGDLTKRVTVQALTQTRDAEGGMVDSWAALTGMPVWAKVANLSGNERRVTSHGGKVAEARTEITIRYRTDITESMRVSYNGKVYNIQHINNFLEENTFLVLTCDTGKNDGR